jgi:hypothetical protein
MQLRKYLTSVDVKGGYICFLFPDVGWVDIIHPEALLVQPIWILRITEGDL